MSNQNLKKIKKQFQYCLAFGAIFTLLVTASFLNLIFNHTTPVSWKLAGIGISISVFWWYCVMNMIYQLIKTRNDGEHMIKELLEEIHKLKYDIEKIYIQK